MIKAILFDMDGVLIDTERINLRFTIEAAKDFGFDLKPEDALKQRSTAPEESDRYYRSVYGEDFDFYAIRDERRRRMRDFIEENGLDLKEGVREVFEHLEKMNLKKAVVTSTQYDRAMNYIRMLGIENRFDAIVSASMVERGKPYPDVYLYATEKINEKPENCIAVEDSPNGVRAAYGAGCKVAIFPDLTEPDEEMRNMGTWVLKSMESLIGILDES
ncbi:MAG: HAD family hydrolase [Candidatus Methanomethylophilaceae archaeon]|jgi:HAD superfamily hydrolase (TIGR01509 family)